MIWRDVDPNFTDAPLRVLRDIDGNRVYQVPVEECKHGRIDPHIVFYTDGTPWHGCPGWIEGTEWIPEGHSGYRYTITGTEGDTDV